MYANANPSHQHLTALSLTMKLLPASTGRKAKITEFNVVLKSQAEEWTIKHPHLCSIAHHVWAELLSGFVYSNIIDSFNVSRLRHVSLHFDVLFIQHYKLLPLSVAS